jgi:hypothetical protein
MNHDPEQERPSDRSNWPVVRGETNDVFLGSFHHDCWGDLTAEQKTWPVVRGETNDVWLGSFDEHGNRIDQPAATVVLTLSASNGHDPAVLSNDLNQLRVAVRQYAAQQGPAEAVMDALKRCLEDGIKLSVE